jgi:excisionase family DNA binding protein
LLLTIPEVCEALGLGRSTVYELLNAGELESVHIRRTRRIPYEALLAYVARLRAAAAEAAEAADGR